MKSWVCFQMPVLNVPGALHSSCVSSLAALIPYSLKRRPGYVHHWLPRVHQEVRAVASCCWDNAHFVWKNTHLNTNGPWRPALASPLSLPQSEVLLALYRSVSFPVFMKNIYRGFVCTRENLSAFIYVNPELPNMAYQSYRWHAYLKFWYPHPWLWVESFIFCHYKNISCKYIIQNTTYFLRVLWWEILALLVLHNLWGRYKLNWTFSML